MLSRDSDLFDTFHTSVVREDPGLPNKSLACWTPWLSLKLSDEIQVDEVGSLLLIYLRFTLSMACICGII